MQSANYNRGLRAPERFARRSTAQKRVPISLLVFAIMAVLLSAGLAEPTPAPTISFRNDIMAVLAKAGCSAGTCHGNKNGKGGFKLSLRGQDPALDYVTLTRDIFARRVNPSDPGQSLILLKPSAQIAHEGGRRFNTNSEPYVMLLHWISQGMPNDLDRAPRLEKIDVQ